MAVTDLPVADPRAGVAVTFEGAAPIADDLLDRWSLAYIRHAPIALTIRELNRLMAMELLEPPSPRPLRFLDVGCGDGFWWSVRDHRSREVYGIDISASEVAQAARRIRAEVGDVSIARPFPDTTFDVIVGNCSLEHVRDINAALRHLRSAVDADGRLILFVPAVGWAYQGLTQSFLLRHFPRLAMMISGAMNGFFQHWHLYDVQVWTHLLEQNGWHVTGAHGLGGARTGFVFRLFLPIAFLGFLAKKLTGRYPSRLWRFVPDAALAPLRGLLRWSLAQPFVDVRSPHAYEWALTAEPSPPAPHS